MDVPIDSSNVQLLLGAIIVGVYALDRFNTPPSNRASTTAGRYYSAAIVYVLLAMLFYYFFTETPALLTRLLQAAGSGELVPTQEHLPPAVVVAMLMSVLLPKLPILAHLDSRLRTFLQNVAEIPVAALRFGRSIHRARFTPTDAIQDAVREELISRGFEQRDAILSDAEAEVKGSPKSLWYRTTALLVGIAQWEQQRGFASFIENRRGEYRALRERYGQLAEVAKACFGLAWQSQCAEAKAPLKNVAANFNRSFEAQLDALSRDISVFFAQGVLKCQLTHAARCQSLKAIGFEAPPESKPRGLSVNRMLTLLVLLVPLVLVVMILFKPQRGPEWILAMAAMIGTTYMVAVFCAVFPKRWPLFQPSQDSAPPVAGYFLSGIGAAVLAVPVNVLFKALILIRSHDGLGNIFAQAWARYQEGSYPWLLMAFTTAFVIAWLCDLRPTERFPAQRLRWLEGVGNAVISMAAAAVVLYWLGGLNIAHPPQPLRVYVTAAFAGFVLGFVAPNWYRRATLYRGDEESTSEQFGLKRRDGADAAHTATPVHVADSDRSALAEGWT